jgi:hypothetical protein
MVYVDEWTLWQAAIFIVIALFVVLAAIKVSHGSRENHQKQTS